MYKDKNISLKYFGYSHNVDTGRVRHNYLYIKHLQIIFSLFKK